jgi:hypothetical protein
VKPRTEFVLFIVIMASMMSLVMSLVLTLINLGLSHWSFLRWMRGFLVAFLVAVPTALVVGPIARRIAGSFSKRSM